MSDPLMTFYKTKDINACMAHWKDTIRKYPEKAADPHFIRIVSGFLCEAIDAGHVSGDILENELRGDEYGHMLRKRVTESAPLTEADAEEWSKRPISLFVMVNAVLDVEFGEVTEEEFLVDHWEKAKASPLVSKDIDLVALEPAIKEALEKMISGPPSRLLDLDHFDQPGYNDLCYVGFGATGDRRYIERVVKVLSQGPGKTEMENAVVTTAAWSLRSLCFQYPDIKAIVDIIPGAHRKIEGALPRFGEIGGP